MATAAELLKSEEIAARTFSINSDLRTVTAPASFTVFGVESDDDVARIYFKGPRFYKGVDLSKFKVRVNILNASGDPDIYSVTDVQVDETTDTIVFSWLIGRFTAQYDGQIKFSLCFRELDDNAYVIREFNTTIATGTILEGLETSTLILQKYPDLIDGIITRLTSLEENGIPAGSLDTTLTASGKAADAKAVGDAINELAELKPLVVGIDLENVSLATHSSSEIYQHVVNGGVAILQVGTSCMALMDCTTRQATFTSGSIPNETADKLYERRLIIASDKTFTTNVTEFTSSMTDEQASQIQTNTDDIAEIKTKVKSGVLKVEPQKYTITLTMEDDSVETHILETNENDYPTKLTVNGHEILWDVTGV